MFILGLSAREKPLMMAFMHGVRYEVKIMMKFYSALGVMRILFDRQVLI